MMRNPRPRDVARFTFTVVTGIHFLSRYRTTTHRKPPRTINHWDSEFSASVFSLFADGFACRAPFPAQLVVQPGCQGRLMSIESRDLLPNGTKVASQVRRCAATLTLP